MPPAPISPLRRWRPKSARSRPAALPRRAPGSLGGLAGGSACPTRGSPAIAPRLGQLRPEQQQHQQEDAFQSQVAPFRPEPLLQRVRPAAHAARADGDGRRAQRQGNIGVGRGAIETRPNAQVRVHCPDMFEDGRIVGQCRRRPRADLLEPRGNLAAEARWFSVSRARSTACSSAPTSSSIFWLLSERMSILARAACAIAFTPAPPSISPTLMADLGEPATAVSANRATARHSACTGLPTPKSLQLWPPGPLNTASKRRLPNARQVM